MTYQNIASITAPEHVSAQPLTSIWTAVFQNDLGTLEPTYRLFHLADRCVGLRRTALRTLRSYSNTLDHDSVKTLLKAARASNLELMSWYESLPEEYKSGENYWILFTKNLYLCHRIFLQDAIARCCHVLRYLDKSHYDLQIIECVETTSVLVDVVCTGMPYHFGNRGPHTRLKNRKQKPFTDTNAKVIFHLSFSQVLA
jgi:hypothetical protein